MLSRSIPKENFYFNYLRKRKLRYGEEQYAFFYLFLNSGNSLLKSFSNYVKFKKQLSYASCSKYRVKQKLRLNSMYFFCSFQRWRKETSRASGTNKRNIYNQEFGPHGLVTTTKSHKYKNDRAVQWVITAGFLTTGVVLICTSGTYFRIHLRNVDLY